ncbi:MAG: L-aspartate oxidase [Deltaproteobacteria bacterium]|jgi:L-aspartate oxidase|nr:L-aspartate oxidase [Deltaproteobacteria bacterium]
MIAISDYLVIGTGVAGLSFALKASRTGTVNILAKREAGDTNTNLAQGGIAAVMGQGDLLEYHVRDTLESGCGLSHLDAVKTVVESGPRMIMELQELGVPFTSQVDHPDQPELGREGGHSHRRIIHAKDMTGQAVQRILGEKAEKAPGVKIFPNHLALDLIMSQGPSPRAQGAWVLDTVSGALTAFMAKVVVLATGGSGKVYLYTTNPDGATGDGLAIAWRAGAKISNMEFVQFHPTCLYHPLSRNFLISEAVRGEGGRLIDHQGQAIMENHPQGDLACRDVVALAIDERMKKTGADNVFLDITHKSPDFIIDRFPKIYQTCLSLGLDITAQPIPVVPAAHYQCGGIMVDLSGRTSIEGLYAIGEVAATGLHGANRLASNSLLEALVMADRAAASSSLEIASQPEPGKTEPSPWPSGRLGTAPSEAVLITHSWDEIRRFMWNYVGLVRSDQRLLMAAKRLDLVKAEIEDFFKNFEVDADLIEVRNIAVVADLIIRCAILRKESRGLHYSLTWPRRDDKRFGADTVLSGPSPHFQDRVLIAARG